MDEPSLDLRTQPTFSPGGVPELAGGAARCVRRLAPPELVRNLAGGADRATLPRTLSDGVSGLDFSASGELVATYRGASVYLFDAAAVNGPLAAAEGEGGGASGSGGGGGGMAAAAAASGRLPQAACHWQPE